MQKSNISPFIVKTLHFLKLATKNSKKFAYLLSSSYNMFIVALGLMKLFYVRGNPK